eukprot:384015_1
MGTTQSSSAPHRFSSDSVHDGFRRSKDSLLSADICISTATMDHVLTHMFNNELYYDSEEETEQLLSEIHNTAIQHGIMNGDYDYIKPEHIVTNICTKFTFIKELGFGGSCRVLLVHDNNTKIKYALKELTSDNEYTPQLFKKEIRLLTDISHPHVVQYHASYIDCDNCYIATRYYEGGTLSKRLNDTKTWTESLVSSIIYDITSAVAYLHAHGIVHRDLKPSNIMFDKPGLDGNLVIIDFGDSERVQDDELYNEFVGTIHYLPPEITRYRHGWELKKSDMWSIGVMMYELLCGVYPFDGSDNQTLLNNIKKGRFMFPQHIVLSVAARSLMKMLIRTSARARLSASDALKHEWFKIEQRTSGLRLGNAKDRVR